MLAVETATCRHKDGADNLAPPKATSLVSKPVAPSHTPRLVPTVPIGSGVTQGRTRVVPAPPIRETTGHQQRRNTIASIVDPDATCPVNCSPLLQPRTLAAIGETEGAAQTCHRKIFSRARFAKRALRCNGSER
jgi:hypothetical protein